MERLNSFYGVEDLDRAKDTLVGSAIKYLTSGGIFVSQRAYLAASLTKFGVHKCRFCLMPA